MRRTRSSKEHSSSIKVKNDSSEKTLKAKEAAVNLSRNSSRSKSRSVRKDISSLNNDNHLKVAIHSKDIMKKWCALRSEKDFADNEHVAQFLLSW